MLGCLMGTPPLLAQLELQMPLEAPRQAPAIRAATAPVRLPFFDDFSYESPSPLAAYWQTGRDVRVTHHVATNAPTIGVATLDAARANGALHVTQPAETFAADTLTSAPIELTPDIDSTVYLSFRFQPGGLGAPPLEGDTLFLDFWAPQSGQWHRAWSAVYRGKTQTVTQTHYSIDGEQYVETQRVTKPTEHFYRAHVAVRGAQFVRPGFQFRFRNLATVSASNVAKGTAGNASHWHLDLVYLDENRHYDDTLMADVGCLTYPKMPFEPYSAIPFEAFSHYLEQRPPYTVDSLAFSYTNFDNRVYNVKRDFLIEDLTGVQPPLRFTAGSENTRPLDTVVCQRSYTLPWEQLAGREVHLRFSAILTTDTSARRAPFRWNDTIRSVLHFTDEYAYDNGAPDVGYGVVGVGAEKAAVAIRFAPVAPTAIKGIRIWFNHILGAEERKNIYLCIWTDKGGRPGTLLYQERVTPPKNQDELGMFHYFELEHAVEFHEPLFVGWRQTSPDMLNVGLDKQRRNLPAMFYQTTGGWLASEIGGVPLLRVVCDGNGSSQGPGIETPVERADEPSYEVTPIPNPATHWLIVESNSPTGTFALYSITGQLVARGLPLNQAVDVSHLPRGLYIIRVAIAGGQAGISRKLVLQ